MENLSISSGAVELMIDNDPNRVISFYPTDISFAEGFYNLMQKYDHKQKEMEKRIEALKHEKKTRIEMNIECTKIKREAFDTIREGIDNTFGDGTSQIVFGDRNTLDMVSRFFTGVTPYIQNARKSEIERYTSDSTESGVMEWN
ncbi:MAG: hypothetical protein ACLUDG_09205 [Butyricicoccus sp.]